MEKFYSTKQAAQILGINKATLNRMVNRRIIKPAQTGANGYRYFSESQLAQVAQIIKSGAVDPAQDMKTDAKTDATGAEVAQSGSQVDQPAHAPLITGAVLNGNRNKFFNSNFLEDLKNQTATIADRLLTHSKDGNYICPFCGNGSRQDGTGIKFNGETAHCFVCNKGFNIFQAVQQQHNCNFNEAVILCADVLNVNLQYDSIKIHSKNHLHNISPAEKLLTLTDDKEYYHRDLTPYYDACNKALFDYPKAVNYLKSRNLFDEVLINTYKIGYDPTINCIVVPHTQFYCTRRQITNDKKFRFIHNLKNAQIALFNADCVNDSEVIFITEGAIDALSIIKAGGSAIAIAGAAQKANRIRLYKLIDQLENKPAIVILFDNDDSGNKQADEMLNELETLKIFGIKKNLPTQFNDSNDMLIRDETALKNFVTDSISEIDKAGSLCYNNEDNKYQNNNTVGADFSSTILSNSSESVNKGADKMNDLISTKEAAEILGVSVETLKNWRKRKIFGVIYFQPDAYDTGNGIITIDELSAVHNDSVVNRRSQGGGKNKWKALYFRERILQLKAVYNKGNLSSIYKMTDPNKCGTSKCSTSRNLVPHKRKEGFYSEDEVAEILSVPIEIISKWRQDRIFLEDVQDHNGVYWYSKERVEQLKSVYHKGWESIYRTKEEIKNDSANDTKKPPRKPLSTCEAVPSCPIDLILPRDFRYTEMGISYRKISDGGKIDYKLAFGTPIAITRCFVNIDEDETEKLEIAFMINGKWKYKIVNSVTLYDAKKIVALRDFGLDVSSSSAKYAVDFIQYLVKDNRDKIPIITAYNQLGWHDDLFVSPFENTDYIVDNQQNNFVNSLKCKGDFEKWKQAYLEILKYPLARFAVACSLAVPLLNITHCRNFTFYTWGTSRAGKTIAALFAASVWGNHKEIVRNFNLTTNAAEGILTENNDFPTFFDEKQLASKHFDFAKTLMTIGNGVNKGRMKDNTKMRVIKHFRTIAITTGEEEIFNSYDTQGVFTRTISAHCDDKILPDALARRLYMMIDDHFGYAGKFFLDNLLNDDFDRIKEFYNYIIDQLSLYDEDKHLPDHIRYIALACLTEALFFKYLFNLSFDSFDKLLTFNFNNSFTSAFMNSNLFIDNYLQTQDDISDVKRAWDWTLGWISANRDHFEIEPNDIVRPPYFGKVSIIEDQKYLFVNNQIFKSELEKSGGFNYSKLIYEFVKKGLIATSSKVAKDRKKVTPTVMQRINQVNTRCIKISFDLI